MTDELIDAANWGVRKRHLMPFDTTKRAYDGGRRGFPLCNRNHEVYDQDAVDDRRRRWTDTLAPRIANLPMCTRCEKKAAARDEVTAQLGGQS